MASQFRLIRYSVCLLFIFESYVLNASSYALNYSQIGVSLNFPSLPTSNWASTGECILFSHSSPEIQKAEFVHLSFPITGWNQALEGTDWKTSSWLGAYKTHGNHWIYHASLGWIYLQQKTIRSIWIWQEELGWVWTHSALFPYFYQDNQDSWLKLDPDSHTPSLVYDFSNLLWFELGRPWKTIQASNNPSIGGTISGPSKFRKGDNLSIYANPKPGYVFSGWSGDYTGNENPLFLERVNDNLQLSANFITLSNALNEGTNSNHLGHLEDESLRKQAKLELALFGNSELISSGQTQAYEFSSRGDKTNKLLVAMGRTEASESIGIFDSDSGILTHPHLNWKIGESRKVQMYGDHWGKANVEVINQEWFKGVHCSVLLMTHPNLEVEKRWLAQDSLQNVWLIHSTLDDKSIQNSPTILIPYPLVSNWQSWLPSFSLPVDHSIMLGYPSSIRTSEYGLIRECASIYLKRNGQNGQNESYAPNTGLVKLSMP